MIQKTTDEIRTLLRNSMLDFDSVENKAMNAYLPRIFQTCPFSEDICTIKQRNDYSLQRLLKKIEF